MALIKIDLARKTGPVDRRILGGFTEHLGRCIYGGIFDEGSPLADEDGFRKDVIEAVRALKPPIMRWPGGNFVSGYHWTDGIGPKENRPRKMDLAWRVEESNRFGTDEFMRFCQLIDAEPYLCINMGTGTLDEAQSWVEYCNGTGNTYWANKRRANGHDEPYNVRLWGLGNEMYGPWQIGATSPEDYVKAAREFAKLMSWTDPSIELVSCGSVGWTDWDEIVIAGLAPFVRYHSVHIYTGSESYWPNLAAPLIVERALRISSALIDRARLEQKIEHQIHIAYDEWGVWYRERENGLEERYTLADALAVATYLHAFVRHGEVVRIANLAQLVNVIAPIVTSPDGLFLQAIYHPLRLFADHLGERALDVQVECEEVELAEVAGVNPPGLEAFEAKALPVLDVVVTRATNEDKVMISVVNRSPDSAVTAEIRFADPIAKVDALVEEVNGPQVGSVNSFAAPHLVAVSKETIPSFQSGVSHSFPAHSHTVISLPLTDAR